MEIHVFVSGKRRSAFLRQLLAPRILSRTAWHPIEAPLIARGLDRLFGRAVPFERMGILWRHRRQFADMDALVVPETTSIFLKTRLGCRNLTLIYTQHGAGDRAVGFKPSIRYFDHVLVPGPKIRDRMLAEEVIRPGAYSEVGYPKFDGIDLTSSPRLFPNDNPVVLYNPHCHPGLTSWFLDGLKVMEFFRMRSDYNLVVAPHVMLGARHLHLSTDPWRLKWRRQIPAKYFRVPHILIDPGSPACVDMTYTRATDIYLGDVSSQIYEFLLKPKPCIFLNSHKVAWEENPNYSHWRLGRVIDEVSSLAPLLRNQDWHDEGLVARQAKAFKATFGSSAKGGALRAARAIHQVVLTKLDRRSEGSR